MIDLNQRQVQILKAIVQEYIETAEPVGSETLEKKYNVGVSPATIRNEMAQLAQMGLLHKPHPSAGRVPTPMAMKFYINQLMEEKELSVTEEVSVKERIWDYRHKMRRLLRESARVLAEQSNYLALVTTNKGNIYHSGYANILRAPEFYDIDVTREVLRLIDDVKRINKLFNKTFTERSVHILLGEELGTQYLQPCGLVFTEFRAGKSTKGYLGIIGPCRLNYSQTIPTVRYLGSLIEEIVGGW
jgi:heat-inducible transcriptional repressor